MAEGKTITSSRDDLLIDASRCLRMRFCESSCRRCVDICPHGAVSLDSGLSIDPQQCRGCLLCTAVCPVGALELNNDFCACITELSRAPEPVLGCSRTNDCSNAALACLGGLSEEHLLTLFHSLAGRLTLNLSLCGDCPNNPMLTRLHQRLDALFAAGLSECGCSIALAESKADIRYRDRSINRRGFFKSIRNSLFKGAGDLLAAGSGQTAAQSEYAAKRLPLRRELLNRTRSRLATEFETRVRNHFDSRIMSDDSCTQCQGCVAICPTGALQTTSTDDPPLFKQLRCTGCGLCVEFCLDKALRLQTVVVNREGAV